jgi:hypothetical protein
MSINKSPNHKMHSPKIQKARNVLTVASLVLGLGIPSMSFSSDWASAWYASPQPRFLPSFIGKYIGHPPLKKSEIIKVAL